MQKYQNSIKSPEQKAFASLLKFVFQITNELLKDVRSKEEEREIDILNMIGIR